MQSLRGYLQATLLTYFREPTQEKLIDNWKLK